MRLVAFVVFLLVFILAYSLALLSSQHSTESAAPPFAVADSLPAFPVAEGFGAHTPGDSRYYDIGNPTLTDLYLSPAGDDANSGPSASAPLRSLTEAWSRVPVTLTTTGYRLNLLPGTYPCEPLPEDINNCINYFSDRHGTYQYPLIVRALSGPGTVTMRGGLNLNNVEYLYLLDLNLVGGAPLPTNASGNNLLHFDHADHVLLHGLSVLGPECVNDTCNNLQEVLKVNQAQYLYVEDSAFGGAWHSTVDYFAVQYGHFLNSRLHTAGQWCMYVKGGSAYLSIEGNEWYGCQLGFEAGQSANFAMLRSPWLHYEAYDIKFVNNLMHDIPGVSLSVAGGYNILYAYNTLYHVGTDTATGYALLEGVFGERNCTPTDELPDPVPTCTALAALGGWGPSFLPDSLPVIPSRNIYVYDNIIYNPLLSQTLYTHFNVVGPIARPAGFQNSPDPANTDDNLVLRGNIIWNGLPDHPLGAGDPGQGCQPDNPTCNPTQLRTENAINLFEPQLIDPAGGNFRPVAGGNVFTATAAYTFSVVAPAFPAWAVFTPAVPSGTLTNNVAYDRDGRLRGALVVPGAYSGSTALTTYRLYLPLVTRTGSPAASAQPALAADHLRRGYARHVLPMFRSGY